MAGPSHFLFDNRIKIGMLEIRDYNYTELEKDIKKVLQNDAIKCFSLGKTDLGREIYCLEIDGELDEKVHINAAHHGLEWITSWVIMNYLYELKKTPKRGISIVPMVNPDGVEIAFMGAKWQANSNGVDLNHNYDANWKKLIPIPCATRHGGESPESEKEVKSLVKYIRGNKFERVLALHSQGEEIYWNFDNIEIANAKELADKMAEVSGYDVSQPENLASFGGFKDWFIKEFNKTGITLELGKGENPLPLSDFSAIYEKVEKIIDVFVKY